MRQNRRNISPKSLVAAAVAAAALLVLAPDASAHHSAAAVGYECDPAGGYLVTWQVASWTTEAGGTHPAIRADYAVDGAAFTGVPDDDSAAPATDAAGTPIAGLGRFAEGDFDFGGVIHVLHTGTDRTIEIRPETLTTAPQDLYYPDGPDVDDELDVVPAGTELFWNTWTKVMGGDLASLVLTLPADECAPPPTTVPPTTVPPTTVPPETDPTTVSPPTAPPTTAAGPAAVPTTTAPAIEVLGLQQSAEGSVALPRTGSEVGPLAGVAVALVAGGALLVGLADRRRRRV